LDPASQEDGLYDPHPLWEYQVIHLNVSDRNSAGDPRQRSSPIPEDQVQPSSSPSTAGLGVQPFSRAYLEQEFPGFYSDPVESRENVKGAVQPVRTPAEQLQSFLNRLGGEGWKLLGIFPVGDHQMLILTRPTPAGTHQNKSSLQAEMKAIFQRLEHLEMRSVAQQQKDHSEESNRSTCTASVDRGQTLTSAEAAAQIGFRSLAPLVMPLREAGEPLGMRRQGPNGLVAEYLGIGVPSRGGRNCRIWRIQPG
jgi:hypothetical protein